ncbi:putative gustatory receptor 28b [Phymastichus coffea]|uniref:putative gustatory receptor 28b n=1 Tax=Phymastichus coffea TaxID=108790 RepID=UPI00273B4474|nr:putative gustatory receptor 28b [Phymastichus coffea]
MLRGPIGFRRTLELSLSIVIYNGIRLLNAVAFIDGVVIKLIYGKEILGFFENLVKQDKYLRNIGFHVQYTICTKKSRWYISTLLIFLITQVLSYILTDFKRARPFLFKAFEVYLTLVQISNIMLFAWMILNVGCRFQVMNEGIRRRMSKTKINDYTIQDNYTFLKTSAKVHSELCNIARRAMKPFIISIINCVIMTFGITTSIIYVIFIELKNRLSANHAFFYFTLIMTYVLLTILIVSSCNWTSQKAAETMKILHKITMENITKDHQCLDEMARAFCMQIVHHNLQFNAWNLFPVDSTLLQSLAEAVTTYLVILIQFDPLIA